MPTGVDASIPLGVQQPQFINPAQLAQFKNMLYAQQLQQLQVQEAQEGIEGKNALAKIMQDPSNLDASGNPNPNALAGLNPRVALDVRNRLIDMQKAKADADRAGAEGKIKDQQVMATEQARVADTLLKPSAQAALQAYESALESGSGMDEAINRGQKTFVESVDEIAKNDSTITKEWADKVKSNKFNPYLFRSKLATGKEDGANDTTAQLKRAKIALAEGRITQEQYDKIETKETGSADSSFAKELRAAGYKPGTKEWDDAMKKRIARETAPTSTMINLSGGGQLDSDTRRYMAEQYLSGDKSVLTGLARNGPAMTAMRNEIVKVAKEKGMQPADVAAATAEFAGLMAGERTLGTRTANIEMAGTEANSLADLALDASGKLGRTGIKSINALEQAAQKQTASPELRAFVAANTSFINAYARAINPQGIGTVADKEHAREMLETAFSKGDYQATIKQLKKEIEAARASPGTVKKNMREGFTGGNKNAKGWVLHEDAKGNKAYVSPDGTQFEEVK